MKMKDFAAIHNALMNATFTNRAEYRDALAALLGPGYDCDNIAMICGEWDVASVDPATARPTRYRHYTGLAWFASMCRAYGPIDATNFFNATRAQFTPATRPDGAPDYVSDSGSRYWYTDEGVYRDSDHWGEYIASCSWNLEGDEVWTYHATPVCGYCRFADFTHK